MTDLIATYSVILKADLPPRERQLLELMAVQLTAAPTSNQATGPTLLCLYCTSIDTSHHFYIGVETFKPGQASTSYLQIPHHYVLLISGADIPRAIGFIK